MKYTYKPFIFILLLAIAMPFISCSEDEAGGSPSITRVRAINPETADSSFTVALLGQLIVVEGVNLSNVQEVYFNDYPATFQSVYNTDTHLIVRIPDNVPTPDRDPDVSNILRIITKRGMAEYQFSVVPPAPEFQEIYNENTRPGDFMEITGKYLFSVVEVIFPGEVSGTNIQKSNDGTRLLVQVPEEVTETGQITLVSPYGSITPKNIVNNTKGDGVFANFNTGGQPEYGWNGWGGIRTDDPVLFPGGDGFYIRTTFANVGGNNFEWWTNNRNVAMNNATKVIVPVSELGNPTAEYVLKFEINTRIPIRKGAVLLIRFIDGNADTYEFQPYTLSPDGVFDTGNKWKTITISLGQLKKTTIGEILTPNGAVGVCNIGITSKAEGIPEFDAAFDNIRIERIVTPEEE